MTSLLNLQSVGAGQRASLWARSAAGFFPGVSVHKLDNSPEVGRIGSMPFGTGLLRGLLMNVLDNASVLDDQQRGAALAAIIELLGASKPVRAERIEATGRRVRAALKCISERYSDATLTANEVAKAQGISRRRLDKLMVESVCETLTARIWNRRLAQAAADLTDPRFGGHSVSQIAFAAGFADAAHFSRAFRQAFECTRVGGGSARLRPRVCPCSEGPNHEHDRGDPGIRSHTAPGSSYPQRPPRIHQQNGPGAVHRGVSDADFAGR